MPVHGTFYQELDFVVLEGTTGLRPHSVASEQHNYPLEINFFISFVFPASLFSVLWSSKHVFSVYKICLLPEISIGSQPYTVVSWG